MGYGFNDPQDPMNYEDITPNDGADQPRVYRCIYVGSGGDLRVVDNIGNEVIFTNVADGIFMPIVVAKVFATNTTASGLIGGY